ncbi:LacI family DNA-binding transcriptional regulator [Nonomuraea soli]|uniref:LacI family DNA-binding transcriptional regulator n=1 Tax=Nonomuraea soli TaxID=1032476 RepID=UPI0015EB648D|nr:LacI family DNA-binding transcriptional regulator [Nonomuraea soli]
MKRPTIADIAQRAGVSKVAVSYALNGRPGVSASTRSAIIAIAEEIGWRPNNAARALNSAQARCFGLALCRPARTLGMEPFFMELISGIEGELAARGYSLMLQVVGDHGAEIEVYRRWWGEGRIDGVFVVDLRFNDQRVLALEEMRMPAVVIGHPSESRSLASIWSDDGEATRETVDYLIALGHRRIARVAGLPKLVHTAHRDAAFREACGTLVEHTIVHTDYSGEEGAHATRRLLSSGSSPTAIIYDNDIMAVAGLSVAQEMSVAVPRELSIVAWDDSPLSQVVHPPLTALSRDIPAYGAHAAQRLLALTAGEHVPAFEDQTARLTPRGSTAAHRQGS